MRTTSLPADDALTSSGTSSGATSSETGSGAATQPLVTVVIPARNEEASIEACLSSVLTQDWTNLQVIVIDGASDDATASIVAGATFGAHCSASSAHIEGLHRRLPLPSKAQAIAIIVGAAAFITSTGSAGALL